MGYVLTNLDLKALQTANDVHVAISDNHPYGYVTA